MNKIAFLGTSIAAVPSLCSLAESREIAAIFCNPDRPKGRGRHLEAPPTKRAAEKLGLTYYQPEGWRSQSIRDLWESLDIDLAIVAAYGYILPNWMLTSCRLGVWNLHFSMLPRWRGASPINYAILQGDKITGVSLMRLTQGLDEGPILAQCCRPITTRDDASSLLTTLALDASTLLMTNISALETNTGTLTQQDSTKVTIAPKLHKSMARIDIYHSAIEIHRQVRALQPWPGTEITIRETLLKVCSVGKIQPSLTKFGTISWNQKSAWLSAGDGNAVELTTLQRSGKSVQPASQALQYWGATGEVNII